MKTPPPSHLAVVAATTAMSVLRNRDPLAVENAFRHLTPAALEYLDEQLSIQASGGNSINDAGSDGAPGGVSSAAPPPNAGTTDSRRRIIAEMLIRRIVYQCLDKYSERAPPQQVEEALKFHTLPDAVRSELVTRYGEGAVVPTTWYEALEQLREMTSDSSNSSNSNNTVLWDLLLDHPMTAYVPVQCQSCGRVVPDDLRSPYTDDELGLAEDSPTESEAPLVRGGWFRGPRPPTVFVLTCPECGSVSRWFRTRDLRTILNPHRWGRLCGEQEDLRLDLANYLGIPTRTCIPLDWDHVWSEVRRSPADSGDSDKVPSSSSEGEWAVRDDSARNFAVRLDQGIGSWTGVLAISPNPEWCCDVTDEYLQCRTAMGGAGRADERFESEMDRYRNLVEHAKMDPFANATQARTLNGYALKRAGFTSSDITAAMRRAVHDYGSRQWYE
jgi:hypothetical protein